MLCHCSFPFYRRQLVIWKRPHFRVGGHHDNVPLTSLTAESIIDSWPLLLCFEIYLHIHAKGTLSICLSLPVVENSRDTTGKSISGRHKNYCDEALGFQNSLEALLSFLYNCTAVSGASTPLSVFPFLLCSAIPAVQHILMALSASQDISLSSLISISYQILFIVFNLILMSAPRKPPSGKPYLICPRGFPGPCRLGLTTAKRNKPSHYSWNYSTCSLLTGSALGQGQPKQHCFCSQTSFSYVILRDSHEKEWALMPLQPAMDKILALLILNPAILREIREH